MWTEKGKTERVEGGRRGKTIKTANMEYVRLIFLLGKFKWRCQIGDWMWI